MTDRITAEGIIRDAAGGDYPEDREVLMFNGSLEGGTSAGFVFRRDQFDFFNGTFVETFNALVTSNGSTITMSLEQSGGGDLTMQFSNGTSTFDCTPAATIALTAGSDSSPTENYIYILQSTKALTKSTSDWPSAEHIKVGYFLAPSASYTQADGVYINQNWNDHLMGTDNQGHVTHMTEKIRLSGATYHSGVAGDGDGGTYIERTDATPDTVYLKTTAGVVLQMHRQAFTAKDTSGSDDFHVINENGDAYADGSDLYNFLNDSTGASMSGKYFNLVLWGVINKSGEYSPLMINLPGGSYSTQTGAEGDTSGYDVYTMPEPFTRESSTGFLIARLTMKHSAGTQDLELISTVDLRGTTPSTATGGVSGVTTEFSDNAFKLFDESDVTKELVFQLSGISTGTERTLTAPDESGTLITSATASWIDLTDSGASTLHKHDHGGQDGLSDDDHPQYLLLATPLGLGGNWDAGAVEIRAAVLHADTGPNVLTGALTGITNLTMGGTFLNPGGDLGSTSSELGDVFLGDAKYLKCGADQDVLFGTDGTTTFWESVNSIIRIRPKAGEEGIVIVPDGLVQLYYNAAARLATTAAGVNILGALTFGSVPALEGAARFENATHAYWRNAANTNSILGIGVDSSDYVLIGDDQSAGMKLFSEVASGDNPSMYLYGYETGVGVKSGRHYVGTNGAYTIIGEKTLILQATASYAHISSSASYVQLVSAGGQSMFFDAGGTFNWRDRDAGGTPVRMSLTSAAGQLALATTGSGAGILIGGDAQLYRGAANRLDLASGDSMWLVAGDLILTRGSGGGNAEGQKVYWANANGPYITSVSFTADVDQQGFDIVVHPSTTAGDAGVVAARFGTATAADTQLFGTLTLDGDLNHDGSNVGFFAVTPAARAGATDDIKDALTTYGLLQGTSATPLNLDGGAFTAGAGTFAGTLTTQVVEPDGDGTRTLGTASKRWSDIRAVTAAIVNDGADTFFYVGEGTGAGLYGYLYWDAADDTIGITTNTGGQGAALTVSESGVVKISGEAHIDGNLNHDGSNVGFFNITPVSRAGATDDIKDALTSYGLLQGTSATPLNLDGGAITSGAITSSGEIRTEINTGGLVTIYRNDGSIGTGNVIGGVVFSGAHGSNDGAKIEAVAETGWGASTSATRLGFYTVPNLSTTLTERMRIEDGGEVIIYGELEVDGRFNHDGSDFGVLGVTPQVQQAHINDADGTLGDITTKFNTLLADMEGYGFLAAV